MPNFSPLKVLLDLLRVMEASGLGKEGRTSGVAHPPVRSSAPPPGLSLVHQWIEWPALTKNKLQETTYRFRQEFSTRPRERTRVNVFTSNIYLHLID